MSTYAFDLVLRQPLLEDSECDALYAAGCDDATIVTREGVTRLAFDRAADSLEAAINAAAADVRGAGFAIDRIELDAPQPASRAG